MKQQPTQALLMQAVALHQQGQLDQAQALYEKVLAKQPKNFDALHLSGMLAGQRQDYELAAQRISHATKIQPNYVTAHFNQGQALQALRRWDEALACYDRVISLKPDQSDAYVRCGDLLRALKRQDEAVTYFDQAIVYDPNNVLALNGRANALLDLDRWEEASADYKKVLAIKPDFEFLPGLLMLVHNQMCAWQSYLEDSQRLREQLNNSQKVSNSFNVLTIFDDPALQKSAAEIWLQGRHPTFSPLGSLTAHAHPHKIRLAYYSADFHNHATAYLMAQLFECHDRERFELYAFSFGPDSADPMRQRLVSAFDHFIDVRSDTDQAVAQRSRDLGIDIAVDLKGYTKGQRVGIFAHRCAPVQVNYLGYPGTMGAPFMDYLIADKVVMPPESQEHYSEQVVHLPHSYQVNDRQRPISDTVWCKADLGLPEEGFVYCCFNNSYKITPHTFASWMRILQAVPGSVLWLLGDNATAQRNLQSHAQAAGIDPSRLVFATRMPLAEHLARHKAADLFLDTLPYNAHTTASDALWAGLPVLTQQGQSFAARVAASLLHAVGLPELIVHTAQEYEELAIALARDPQRLSRIKAKLARQRDTAPLFNTAQLARHIEQAYQTMHERAQAGLAAQGFEVAASRS